MDKRMKAYKQLASGVRCVVISVIAVLACGAPSVARTASYMSSATQPTYAANQVLVTVRGGVPESTVKSFATEVGGTIVRKPKYSHTYVVELPASTGTTPAARVVSAKTAYFAKYPGIQFLDYNYYAYVTATPNDEFYPTIQNPNFPGFLDGQWALRSGQNMYAPEGWDLQKGSQDVIVAVIDSGVRDRYKFNDKGKLLRTIHPDLANRVLSGYDMADLDSDDDDNPGPSPSEVVKYSGVATHGTHVAGIIAAQADNWIGTAGLCWDNVWILPLKVAKDSNLAISSAAMIDAIYAAIQWRGYRAGDDKPLRVGVINMSIGRSLGIEAEEQVIRQAVQSGIIVVASAGNEWEYGPFGPGYPAAYEDSVCVGATGYDDIITTFSNHGRAVDIAAPGYDVLSTVWYKGAATVDDEPEDPNTTNSTSIPGVRSVNSSVWPQPSPMPTWPDKYGNGYEYMSGTSMSSPYVAAAAALLLSHGVPPTDVRGILYETATAKGVGRPNDTYGWGVLNIGAALHTASIDVKVASPGKGAVVPTSRPTFRIDLRHADPDTIRVWIDGVDSTGDGVPDNQPTLGGDSAEISNWRDYLITLDEAAGKSYLLFNYSIQPDRAINGVHKVFVMASSDIDFDTPPTVPVSDRDLIQFRIEPQTMSSGWRMFSIPAKFDVAKSPREVLGNTGLLARWHYTSTPYGEYALYSLDGTRTDEESTFTPAGVYTNSLVHPVSQPDATSPAGLGYWLYLPSSSEVELPDGAGQSITEAPYVVGMYYGWNMVGDPFPFPVDWSNVVVEYAGMRATAEEAVQKGWIANSIYRYDTVYRRYTYKPVNTAVMMPWEAQWVKVKVRTPEIATRAADAWAEEFNDGVLDMTAPEPDWYVGTTYGSATEAGGMLRLTGTVGQPSYLYATNKDFPIYGDFSVDTKIYLAASSACMTGGQANAEVRFRTNTAGDGYSLTFKAGDVPGTVCLRRSDTGAVIQSKQVDYDLASGSVLYANIACIGTRIKIKVGTLPGLSDVAGWELTDSTFTLPGSFSLVNDGMVDCRWDYFRFSPLTARPPDVKIIIPPNAYTGSVQY